MSGAPIAIVESVTGPRHFTGVDAALADRGGDATWIPAGEQPHRLGRRTRVVAVADTRSFEQLNLLRQARDIGACTVLLMDGILEHRNTYCNPRVGARFLRPAPVDVIACAGEADRRRLIKLGNDAVATGLPRLSGIGPMAPPAQPAVLVATALQPAFSDAERRLLLEALAALRARLDAHGIRARWRLTEGLAAELGTKPDAGPLAEALAASSAVITTPSTLLIEAMRAGRPTAMLFPFDAPCWPRAAWVLGPGAVADPDRIDAVLRRLLAPGGGDRRRQERALARMHRQDRPPAEAVADLLMELVEHPRRKERPARLLDPVRLPPRLAADPQRPRVVSLVQCDISPVGGVTTWSKRMAGAFARRGLGYDFRTLLVVTHPDSLPPGADRDQEEADDRTHVCVIDPTADHWRTIDALRRAIEQLEPAIIIPNYAELCYVAAMQLQRRGARVVAVAHADDPSYRNLLAHYGRWDGAVGVSGACMNWIRPQAGDRPLLTMPCAAPVADAPRRVEPDGPLKLAYVGRVIGHQKRVGDLLELIDGLESRGAAYEFHLVGDGPQLPEWRAAAAQRRLRHGRIIVHGRRSHEWVERFVAGIDVSVLVSDYEGTSVTMLEAMGAGVVPAVTRVSSGVDEWVRDGANGIVVPIGEPDRMAGRLADLAADRGRIAAMGRAAWSTVRDRAGIDMMALGYRELFDAVLARQPQASPTEAALRLRDRQFWCKEWAQHADEAMTWIRSTLHEAGYRRIAIGEPAPGCDAVILSAGGAQPLADRAAACRAIGLGVAVAPHMIESPHAEPIHRVLRRAIDDGCRRIAIYGVGRHTRRAAALLELGLPIVGFIDDDPPPWRSMLGLPIVAAGAAQARLAPDAVLLSSDAWEEQMWHRCAPLRKAGVRLMPLYGTYDRMECLEAGVSS